MNVQNQASLTKKCFDVAIVGGGLAGSLAAVQLGRANLRVALIDVNAVYQPEFRCEKLTGQQLELMRTLGLFDCVEAVGRRIDTMHIARFGRLVERAISEEHGFPYQNLVNEVRKRIPATVDFVVGRVEEIVTNSDLQRVELANGARIDARLIVLASGPLDNLQRKLGISRCAIRDAHSLTIGFNLKSADGAFAFPALTYYGDKLSERVAYVSFFPIADDMRANLFCYRGHDAKWARAFRENPRDALFAMMPGLRRVIGNIEIIGKVAIRRTDLYTSEKYLRDGIVLIGDAFQSSCPATGNGTTRVMIDVNQLCGSHIPSWLATRGMGVEKITQFYDDPVKRAGDAESSRLAEYSLSFATSRGMIWRARRLRAYLQPRMRSMLRIARLSQPRSYVTRAAS